MKGAEVGVTVGVVTTGGITTTGWVVGVVFGDDLGDEEGMLTERDSNLCGGAVSVPRAGLAKMGARTVGNGILRSGAEGEAGKVCETGAGERSGDEGIVKLKKEGEEGVLGVKVGVVKIAAEGDLSRELVCSCGSPQCTVYDCLQLY